MTDAEELAVLREFAAKTSATWTCMGDFFVGVTYKDSWMARRITECRLRGVSYEDGSILAEADSPGPCILAARAKLQSERDAKDAPRLRELLQEFIGIVPGNPIAYEGNLERLADMTNRLIALRAKSIGTLHGKES
jgi:hypothetical protein